MKMQICNRWTGAVICEGEFDDIKSLIKANPGANLRDANLRDANLRGANLRDANLRDADLRDANPVGANLRDADLRDADLRGADLRDADLGGADLRGANLRGANLGGANLVGADLDFASWPLWCGSTRGVILDDRLRAQLMYHALCLVGDSVEVTQTQKDFVNANFHRIGELPKL